MEIIGIIIIGWLTSIDEGCTHQGSWGRVGDVAGTAMSTTQVAVQAEGQETLTGREPTSSWAAPPNNNNNNNNTVIIITII